MANDTPDNALVAPGAGGAGGGTATTSFSPASFGPGSKAFLSPRNQPNRLSITPVRSEVNGKPGDNLVLRASVISGAWDHFVLDYTTEISSAISPRTFTTFPVTIGNLTGSGSGGAPIIYHATWRIQGYDVNGEVAVDTGWLGPN